MEHDHHLNTATALQMLIGHTSHTRLETTQHEHHRQLPNMNIKHPLMELIIMVPTIIHFSETLGNSNLHEGGGKIFKINFQ